MKSDEEGKYILLSLKCSPSGCTQKATRFRTEDDVGEEHVAGRDVSLDNKSSKHANYLHSTLHVETCKQDIREATEPRPATNMRRPTLSPYPTVQKERNDSPSLFTQVSP